MVFSVIFCYGMYILFLGASTVLHNFWFSLHGLNSKGLNCKKNRNYFII